MKNICESDPENLLLETQKLYYFVKKFNAICAFGLGHVTSFGQH